jgi:hypothetical protein
MADKLSRKKPVVRKSAKSPPEKTPKDLDASKDDKERSFNATTRKALRDAEDGQNMTDYTSVDEMFKDLGM